MVDYPPLVSIDALGTQGARRTQQLANVNDVTGRRIAALSQVPGIFITRAMAALGDARSLPAAERLSILKRAAGIFRDEVVAGLSRGQYELLVSRASGVPIATIHHSVEELSSHLENIQAVIELARPAGAVSDWREPAARAGTALWVRKGSVFAVGSAGNYPGIHTGWLEAIALGYKVAVRPSSQEPFTPQRLVAALRAAGLPNDHVLFLPCDYAGADEMMRTADLATVFGGDEVVRRYADQPKVFTQGPGRTKVLVSADIDWRAHLDVIVDSIAGGGGMGCVNATAVLVEGDPTPLAEAIAERLGHLPSLPPEHPNAALPVQPLERAKALDAFLQRTAAGCTALLGGGSVVHDLGDGSAVMRPAVHLVARPNDPQMGVELPFPCVWLSKWSRDSGLSALRNSLVLSVFSRDESLVDELVCEPSIRNVYLGNQPSHFSRPGMPHDGYVAEFLMRTKGAIVA